MKMRPLSIGDIVVSIRDVEMSNRATVIGEENERGFISVQFSDGIPRSVPVQSVERVVDRKNESQSRPQSRDWIEAANLGDYITRLEAGISQKEKRK